MQAKEQLREIIKKRKWYGDKMERRTAAMIATRLRNGTLSYEKACEVLLILGYRKTMEEEWTAD